MSLNQEEMIITQQEYSQMPPDLDLTQPIDPAKIDEVLNRYAQKHVIHKNGAIIFAGSGAGKSTYCRTYDTPNAEGKINFIDEDLVYRETGAHPCIPGTSPLKPMPWWTWGNEAIGLVEKRCDQVNKALVDKGLWAFTTSFTPKAECQPAAIVLLPWEEHKKRIIEKFNSEHFDGGAKPDESGFKLVLGHRAWTKKVAIENNIPVVDSIDKAVEIVKSLEND